MKCKTCSEIRGWVRERSDWYSACPECNEEEAIPFPGSRDLPIDGLLWGVMRVVESQREVDLSGFFPSN